MKDSKIEWTDHTFNPWWGCTKVSQGCKHCYAEALAKRTGSDVWGPEAQRRRTSAANWREPYKWDKAARAAGTRARVFCASMADVFEEHSPELDEWRSDLFDLISNCRSLDWLLLTKRPENVTRFIERATWQLANKWLADCKHVWIGTSIEDQATADERIPHLLRIPARVRFLSIEPLLGPVNIQTHLLAGWHKFAPSINWMIVGGESGPHARPMHPSWARSLRDQCAAAGTAFFFKQWGEWAPGNIENAPSFAGGRAVNVYGYGSSSLVRLDGSPAGNVHAFDATTGAIRVGKRTAGRLLDGIEWNQFPASQVAI